MKSFFRLLTLLMCVALSACGTDEPEIPGNSSTSTESSTNNSSVSINVDGSTSTGVVFSPIDETTFFLDFIKYKIVDSHLEIIGYDPIEIGEHVQPYAYVTYHGVTYVTRVVGERAFAGSEIKSISLPEGLKTIRNNAFYWCDLESVIFPEGLETIGAYAFYYSDLLSITSNSSTPPRCALVAGGPFSTVDQRNCVLYVPASSIEKYKSVFPWNEFLNIQGI